MRSDRTKGNRGAFEAARLKILKTQTICGICGKPVDFSYKNPHPLAPTVDHIIPVSKGGHPSDISNLQLAHRYCNRAKADSLLGPKKAEENDNVIPNDVLEQHLDWAAYRSKEGDGSLGGPRRQSPPPSLHKKTHGGANMHRMEKNGRIQRH